MFPTGVIGHKESRDKILATRGIQIVTGGGGGALRFWGKGATAWLEWQKDPALPCSRGK